jgi:hypothetical protein
MEQRNGLDTATMQRFPSARIGGKLVRAAPIWRKSSLGRFDDVEILGAAEDEGSDPDDDGGDGDHHEPLQEEHNDGCAPRPSQTWYVLALYFLYFV